MTKFTGKPSLKVTLALTTALGGYALPHAAHAQDSAASTEVIMVTARRQSETLQEVPVTVSVIGADTLNAYQINEVADLQSRIPGLNVQTGGSGSGGQISLRGVGSSNISAAFDSAVAFNFDGIIVTTMRMVQAGFFDTQQIEVLKGPQSLYFGKSASAGVLSIKSKDPTDELEMQARASYEFEEQGYLVEGIVSGPITDTMGFRLAAQYNGIDEFVELAPGTPAANQERGLDTLLIRGTLDWEPNDALYANLKGNYMSVKGDGSIQHTDIDCGADGIADPSVLGIGLIIPVNNNCDSTDQLYNTADPSAALGAQLPDGARGRDTFDGEPFSETEIFSIRLAFDYDIGDNFTLSSITGYLDMQSYEFDCFSYDGVGPVTDLEGNAITEGVLAGVNGAGSPQGAGCSDPENNLSQFSQEFRLASNFDGPFNFLVGAFYEDRTIDFFTSQQAVNIALLGPDPVTGSTFDWYKKQTTDATALSFFASGEFEITDRLTLAGGLRWTDESKTAVIDVPFVHAFLAAGPAFIDSGFNSGDIEFDDSELTPEVTLSYEVSDNINVYAAYKTGFKSGGIDNSALPSSSLLGFGSDDPDVRQATADGIIFSSETSEGFEIGMKSVLADGALTFNTTIYRYVFTDLQLQNFLASEVQFETLNASELTTQGVEIDWVYLTAVDGLTLNGAASLLDAEFSAPFATSEGTDLNGRDAPRAPEFSGNIAADYTRDIGNNLVLGLSGNLSYFGSYFLDQGGLDDPIQDSYLTVDTAISLGNPDAGWQVSVAATNLTDQIWNNTSSGRPFVAAGGGDTVVTQNRGRQIFLEARMAF